MRNICYKFNKRNIHTGTDKENLLWSFRDECCICMENPVQTALLDCGHMNLCLKCAREISKSERLRECPVCRAELKGFATFTPNIKYTHGC